MAFITLTFHYFSAVLLVFTPKINSRIQYIFHEILHRIIGVNYSITESVEEFLIHNGAKFSYGGIKIENEIHIDADKIILERGVKQHDIEVFDNGVYKYLFKNKPSSDWHFDIFSASFYLLSRYEEYLLFKPDKHNRYEAKNALAFKNGFLQTPIINVWCKYFKDFLAQNFPNIKFEKRNFKYEITFDIDFAYTYKGKGISRNVFGVMKDALKGDYKAVKERLSVLFAQKKDPYDVYDYIFEMSEKYKFQPFFFFLLADFGTYDHNIPVYNKKFQSLIKSIADNAIVGIHPSYASNYYESKVEKEILRLKEITNRKVVRSRQHFLKLRFPKTYRTLIENNIRHDYTMGYADAVGFRAGVANEFYWYDLIQDIRTNLTIHPFAAMDVTLKDYLKLNPDESNEQMEKLILICKKYDAVFSILWHNNSLTENEEWKNWKVVFERVLQRCNT